MRETWQVKNDDIRLEEKIGNVSKPSGYCRYASWSWLEGDDTRDIVGLLLSLFMMFPTHIKYVYNLWLEFSS